MYVCICHGITDRQVRETLAAGAQSLPEVQLQIPVGGCCGRCVDVAQQIVDEHLQQNPPRRSNKAA